MENKIVDMFNEQINYELYSAYIYLAMAAYCENENLPGFAHWLKLQCKEETGHAMKMFNFVQERGNRVTLKAIPEPLNSYASVQDVFEKVLEHEQKVTVRIEKMYMQARQSADAAAEIFLQYFVTEQVEEEKNVTDILALLARIKPDSAAMVMLDRELAKRQ